VLTLTPSARRIGLLYTGGTIGAAGRPLASMGEAEFRALWQRHVAPRLDRDLDLFWTYLDPPMDSTEMQPRDWLRLTGHVLDLAERCAGVLVLHGTDTMAWSAAAMAYLTQVYDARGQATAAPPCPVAITGAQLPLFEGDALRAGGDAMSNLWAALSCLSTAPAGVHLVFAERVLSGTRAVKVDTIGFDGFDAPNGSLALPALPAARPGDLRAELEALAPEFGRREVLTLVATPMAPERRAAAAGAAIAALGPRLGAIHLLGYGVGPMPGEAALAPVLARAREAGAILVAGSQIPKGPALPATYGAGAWLEDLGAVPTGDMAAGAVQAKLHLALALAARHSWDLAAIERFVAAPLAGDRGA